MIAGYINDNTAVDDLVYRSTKPDPVKEFLGLAVWFFMATALFAVTILAIVVTLWIIRQWG